MTSRASAWVGSFPRPSQPSTTTRRSHLLIWCCCFFSGHERSTIGLGELAPSPLQPTSTIPPLPFFRVCYFFSRALEPPGLDTYGTFLARNRALPRPLRCSRREMLASHPGYRFGWASSPSLATHHPYPPPSTGDAHTVHLS